MAAPKGAPPPQRQELIRVEDRLSFLYVEHCTVHRDSNALTLSDQRGTVHVPAATLGALMLGPGTRVTHGAMRLLGDVGVTTVWTGEMGVRYYAHGRPLAKSSRLAMAQARLVSHQRSRLEVARAMYSLRFPGEDVGSLTMSQLRGREGSRMKRVYRDLSRRTGVEWRRRDYQADDFEASDPINKALTSANACLYGVAHTVAVSLGCVPSLGFVHQGTDRAFIYDIADLYKADIAVPAAFEAVSEGVDDPETTARRRVRDAVVADRLLPRMVRDIYDLLRGDDLDEPEVADLVLWTEPGDRQQRGELRGRGAGMITLVLGACPAGLRGDLTKWLLEISPGVFVGEVSARVRDLLWERTVELCKDGRALLILNAPTEQGFSYRTHNHEWEPVDWEGVLLLRRPAKATRPVRREPGGAPPEPRSALGAPSGRRRGRQRGRVQWSV